MWRVIQILFLYVAGHSLADTALQKHDMGKGKNRHNPVDMSKVPVGQKPLNLWPMWITHHALIQGLVATGITYFITSDTVFSINIGMLEFASHLAIDFFKCENAYGPYADQSWHIVMKLFYAFLIVRRTIC